MAKADTTNNERLERAFNDCAETANILHLLMECSPYEDGDQAGWGYQALLKSLDARMGKAMSDISEVQDDLNLARTAELSQAICTVVEAMEDKLDPESFDAFTGYIDALEGDKS